MAKKKAKVYKRNRGGVPAKQGRPDGFALTLVQTEQDQSKYRKLLDKTNKRFSEAEKDYIQFNSKRLVMMWETGKDWRGYLEALVEAFRKQKLAEREKAKAEGKKEKRIQLPAPGQIPDDVVKKVAQDLAPFGTGQPVTKEILRMCLRAHESYPEERIRELAKYGINENQMSVFLQLEDPTLRKQLEDKTVKENLNGVQVRNIVKEMAKDPAKAKAIRGASMRRYKQAESTKKSAKKKLTENPGKMVQKVLSSFEASQDELSDLYVSMDHVESLEPAEQSKLVEPLDELIGKITEMINTLNSAKDAAFGASVKCKQALATEGETQGTKGGDVQKKTGKKKSKKKSKKKRSSKKSK